MNGSRWQQQLAWVKNQSPLTGRALAAFLPRTGALVAVRFHIDLKMIPVIESLSEKVRLVVFPCHPDTTDKTGWTYLQERTSVRLESNWSPEILRTEIEGAQHSFLCDLGGDLITWASRSAVPVLGAMEGTTTGVKQVSDLPEPPAFPVLDWNGAALKQEIHNEKMVGFSLWQTFTEVTRLSLHGKSVGVLGFGLVGRGIARQARALGGEVRIYEPNPERRVLATYEGFSCPSRAQVLRSDVVVSATGRPEAITEDDLGHFSDGAFVLNAGHSETEITAALREHPTRTFVLKHVEEVRPDAGVRIYLLAGGRLLNLAAGFGDTINAFDLTSALLVGTLDELLDNWRAYPKGLCSYSPSPSSSPVSDGSV